MILPTPAPLRDAETDFVWVIVPMSRPENAQRVAENFRRQKFPFKKLVVVQNGRAVGTPMQADLLLTSQQHQSAAKNTALSEICRRGGGFTVVMDDDDWYGPQFLTEACGYARTYDITGKGRHFVSVDGNLWLCTREQRLRAQSWLMGGTIACWAEDAPEYPLITHGEDAEFCLAAERSGMRLFGTDVYHYLYRREAGSSHAWAIDHQSLRRLEIARRALDLGNENLDVVSGLQLLVDGCVLGARQAAETLLPPAPLQSRSAHVPA